MRGRRPGRPITWLTASIDEPLELGRTGITFGIWRKWKKKDRKLGTLTVSVGGLRWLTSGGRRKRRRSWREVAEWLEG